MRSPVRSCGCSPKAPGVGVCSALLALVACDRPVARLAPDIGVPGTVRLDGRVVIPDDDDPSVPWTSIREDEVKNAGLEWRTDTGESGPAKTDDEGWVHERLPRWVEPGRRRIHLRDASKARLGTTTVHVLDARSAPRIVRSDVDLTYLETRFETTAEIAGLLRSSATAHRPIAGMPALYRGLRASLVFLSGSPELFRAHLQARLALDRIPFDALRLKPMGDAAWREVRSGRVDRIEPMLREQLGYKLQALLADRLRWPRDAREVLLGDDSEMDPFAYCLYREASSGRMTLPELRRQLALLGVPAPDIGGAARLVPSVRRLLGTHETVAAIFIRRTPHPNRRYPSSSLESAALTFHPDTPTLTSALHRLGWL